MPIHDWSKVDAGVFHGFHVRWVARLAETLMPILPPGYYAEAEQHASSRIADILALRTASKAERELRSFPASSPIKTATLDMPRVAERRTSERRARDRRKPKHVAIRHVSGHRVVALIEIISPGNKDRRSHVANFVDKAELAISSGVHFVAVDLFPPTPSAPHGIPSRIWRRFEREPIVPPVGRPLTFASFAARPEPAAFFEFRSFGKSLPSIPLFLTDERYLDLPLDETYDATFEHGPPYLKDQLNIQVKG